MVYENDYFAPLDPITIQDYKSGSDNSYNN